MNLIVKKPGSKLALAMAGLLLAANAGAAPAAQPQDASSKGGGALAAPVMPESLSHIDQYVHKVLAEFNVPGISVAIVKDGRVLLEKGYGVRDLETGAPADAHTLFAIASNTKAFTGAALEILDQRGKLDMDEPVITYLPWFRMSSDYVTRELRVRDLLAHNSGLPSGQTTDLLFTPDSTYSTKEVVKKLVDVPLSYSFRADTAYDNILFGTAALLVEEVSGQSFREFLQQNIFQPLGMNETRYNYHFILDTDKNVSNGYVPFKDEGLKVANKMAWSNSPGAAGLYSSVHDMAKWVTAQLSGTRYGADENGEPLRLISEDRHQRSWTMRSISHPYEDFLELVEDVPLLKKTIPEFQGWGEGWHISQYNHHKMVYHTGGWPGFVSRVTMIPSLKLGIVVLTNQREGGAFNSITYHILDAFMGNAPQDWIGAYNKIGDLRDARKDKRWKEFKASRDPDASPSFALDDYAGKYQSWYGETTLTVGDNEQLRIAFSHTPNLNGTLQHWSRDTFYIHWDDRMLRGDAFITFNLNAKGEIRSALLEASPEYQFSYMFNDITLTPVTDKEEQ